MRLFFLRVKLLILLSILVNSQEKFLFTGYQLFQLAPKNIFQQTLIKELENNETSFDVWAHHAQSGLTDVLLPPDSIEKFKIIFETHKLDYTVLEINIQNKINEQEKSMIRKDSSKSIIFKYARYSEIMNFIDDVVNTNIDIASSYIAGKTFENRQLKVIKIKAPNASTTKSVWIDCGIHAREWVSPATCVYMIDQLIKEYRDNEIDNVLKKYEFHILPLLNPDGYEYSHVNYRLWRKNRFPNAGFPNCPGVDLNRNYNYLYYWNTVGASENPCSDIYAGKTENSELETKAVISAIFSKTGQWDAFFSLHSYGNWWLTPYGTLNVAPNHNQIIACGQKGAAAIKAYKNQGQIFTVGTSADLLYLNSGGSIDWARGTANIPYAYVLELRPGERQDDSSYGFTLPEDRMPLVAPETFAGIKACLNSI